MEQLRMILLAALAGVGVLLYQKWQAETVVYTEPVSPAPVAINSSDDAPAVSADRFDDDAPPALPQAVAATAAPAISDARPAAQWVQIETDLISARISLEGADIKRLRLLNYPEHGGDGAPPLPLLNSRAEQLFVVQSGIVSEVGPSPLHHAQWSYSGPPRQVLADGQDHLPVRFTWNDELGRQVQRTYHFSRGSYEIEVSQTLINEAAGDWTASPYWRFVRKANAGSAEVPFVATFLGVGSYLLDDGRYKFRKHDLDDLRESSLAVTQRGGWTAMLQHYFVAAILPPENEEHSFFARPSKIADFLTEYVAQPTVVTSGASAEHSVRLYIGPKLQNQLEQVAPGLALTVDYGLLTPISEPLFWVMDKFHDLTGNWGWSIILVTLVVKGLFFKLSEAQYRSMARMKKFAPRIQAIKERYADDRQRLHQAMMDLYQKEGFNPLAGCWPMLVQFPVFIALYWVLLESVELRQAPFVLWLDDLSAPDQFFVLPILFGISMFFQQKLSGQAMTMEPMQQKIMNIMPIALAVFFAFFPCGLVLYWFVSNLIGIAQQWFITRRIEAEAS